MSLSNVLGWIGAACMIPLLLKGVRPKNKGMRFLHKNHYFFGWFMLIISTFHALLMLELAFDYFLGTLSYFLLLVLNSLLFVKRKTKTLIGSHKFLAVVLVVLLFLHVLLGW